MPRENLVVRFSLARSTSKMPVYGTDGAAGLDLFADVDEPTILQPWSVTTIETGVILEIPDGYEGTVRPRSGMARKHKAITVLGTVDSDYRGGVGVILGNWSDTPYIVHHGAKVAQIVISPVPRVQLVEVPSSELSVTARGAGGFGSTGV